MKCYGYHLKEWSRLLIPKVVCTIVVRLMKLSREIWVKTVDGAAGVGPRGRRDA